MRGLTNATHAMTSFWLERTFTVATCGATARHCAVTLSGGPGRSTSNLPGPEIAKLRRTAAAAVAHVSPFLPLVQPLPPQSAMASLPLRTLSSQVTALPPCWHNGCAFAVDCS